MSAATGALIVGAVGLATSLTTTGLSFKQAATERDKMNAANDAAAEAMVEARKKLDVNYMDELSINKEAYEMQQDTILAQAQAATQLGVEGDARGASATAGRVQLATSAGAQQTRVQMGAELQKLEQLSAQEDSRLRDIGVQLDLQEVQGAQAAARDAEARAVAAQQEGIEGAIASTQQAASLGMGLYGGDAKGEKAAMQQFKQGYAADKAAFQEKFKGSDNIDSKVNAALKAKYGDFTYTGQVGRGKNKMTFEDTLLTDINFDDMTNKQWKDWSGGLDAEQSGKIFGSEAWSNLYQKPDYDPFAWQYGAMGAGTGKMDPEMMKQIMMLKKMGILD